MSVAAKEHPEPAATEEREGGSTQRSGEHAIELDGLVRRTFEEAFETELQATSRMSPFDLDDVLASPEARPTAPPIVGVPIVNVASEEPEAIALGSLPPPAVEIDRTKGEERDP